MIARILGLIDMLSDRLIDEPASWLELSVTDGVGRCRIDFLERGAITLLIALVSTHTGDGTVEFRLQRSRSRVSPHPRRLYLRVRTWPTTAQSPYGSRGSPGWTSWRHPKTLSRYTSRAWTTSENTAPRSPVTSIDSRTATWSWSFSTRARCERESTYIRHCSSRLSTPTDCAPTGPKRPSPRCPCRSCSTARTTRPTLSRLKSLSRLCL